MILTRAQATQYASQAGFSGAGLDIIVAIAQAESSLNTNAQHINTDGSIDRGILQINSRWHPEVSDSCAYSALCSFQQAYKISSNGSNFGPWATFTSGLYLRYLSGGSGQGITTNQGTKHWYDFPVTHGYYPTAVAGVGDTPHYAVDIGTPFHTPLTALEAGTIATADYQAWGGEVYIKPDNKSNEIYYAHLDEVDVKPGQHVSAGQIIGLSGGENPGFPGAEHPTQPQYSSGPHTHFGYHTGWAQGSGGPGTTTDYGPDPTGLINEARLGQLPGLSASPDGSLNVTTLADTSATSDQTIQEHQGIGETVNAVLSELPGFGGIALALDLVEQFPGIIWYQAGKQYNIVAPGWAGDIINGVVSGVASIERGDFVGAAIRSILDTIISNTAAFLIRGFIVAIGLLLIGGLIWNALDSSGLTENIGKIAGAAAV